MGAGSSVEVRDTSVEDHQPEPSRSWGGTYRKASSIRKPRMPLPIFCPSCKAVSFSRKYNFEGCYFYSFGNTETCPSCGQQALLSEGVFDLTGEVLEIVSGPDFTYAMHTALRGILDAVERGDVPQDTAIYQIGRIAPALGASLIKAAKFGGGVVTLLIGVISLHLLFKQDAYQKQQTLNSDKQTVYQQQQTLNSDKQTYYSKIQTEQIIAQTKIQQQALDLQEAAARAQMAGVRRARALESVLSAPVALGQKMAQLDARHQPPVSDGGAPPQQEADRPATPNEIPNE